MSNHFWIYYESYIDAITEFIESELEILNSKDSLDKIEKFYFNFYYTCKSMLDNGVELSNKQIPIIEREMTRKHVKIPKSKDYCLSLKIFVKLNIDNKKFAEKVDLGDFFLLLSKREDINNAYEKAFESQIHIKDFHTI